MATSPAGRYRCRTEKSLKVDEVTSLIELARLLETGYAVAFVRLTKADFHVRAVKNELVVEAKGASIPEALHKAFVMFREREVKV